MATDQAPLLETLRQRVARLETGGRAAQRGTISCGCSCLDDLLPGGGLNPGTLNEWVEHLPGSGGGWLSLLAARQALTPPQSDSAAQQGTTNRPSGNLRNSSAGGQMVVIDWRGEFQPAAAQAAGISPSRLIVLRPATRADGLWAIDQALRSPAIGVVWGFLERLDDREARRLQLAAEVGNTLGLWLRPHAALSEPSWAEVRWYVRGLPLASRASQTGQPQLAIERRLEARLTRCRGGQTGQRVVLEIDSAGRARHVSDYPQTAAMPLAAQLAHPATHRQRAQQRTA